MKKNVTMKEAAEKWVREMNVYPQALIEKAYGDNIDDIQELTLPAVGTTVWSHELQGTYEITHIDGNTAILDDEFEVDLDDVSVERDSWLPMWGYLWNPENLDEEWIKENLDIVSAYRFRIFESEEVGILLGIDGAGYDFFEAHWIPLYKARGLQWHTETEQNRKEFAAPTVSENTFVERDICDMCEV